MTTDNGARVSIEGLDEVLKQFDTKQKSILNAVDKGIKATCMDILNQAKRNLVGNESVITGMLRQSGKVEKNADGDYEVSFTGGKADSKGYSGYYAACVEFGTRAHKVSKEGIESLMAWVRKKGLTRKVTYLANGNRRFSGKVDEQAERSMAYAIAKSIARFGTKAHPFLYPAYRDKVNNLTSRIEEQLKKVIGK